MKTIWSWLCKKTLARRLFIVFSLVICSIWLGLIIWGYHSLQKEGLEEAQIELQSYARQIMLVVEQFSHEPERLSEAIKGVEAIENGDDPSQSEDIRFQVWLEGKELISVQAWPKPFPETSGFEIIHHQQVEWWTSTAVNIEQKIAVRTGGAILGVNLALNIDQMFFLFIPLVISLPFLLIPVWLLTRSGLTPLTTVANQINHRVLSGELAPLPSTPYLDIEPLIKATNRFMGKLKAQRVKEHEFVANVAHELKTPMAILQANVGILQDKPSLESKTTALNDLNTGISRANHLIHQLLRMARMEQEPDSEIAIRNIDLAEFLRERVALAEPLAKQKELVLYLAAPKTYQISVDTDGFAAIVDNLLDNAIKYSPKRETVKISILIENQNRVKIIFEDNGEGISPQEMDSIFTRFKRAKSGLSEPESSGLGLAIVYQACKRMGAKISLKPGHKARGLRAEVTLYRAQIKH